MRYQRLLFVFLGLFATAMVALAQKKDTGDAKQIQGTWKIIGLEANGEKKPAEEIEGSKLVVENDELWVVKSNGPDPKLKFRLNPSQSPKTIDLIGQEETNMGKVFPGIYALNDSRLRLCVNIFGDLSYRPTEFKTRDGDGVGYLTLERARAK